MATPFKAIRLQAGQTWAVVLTTQEGDDHRIDGFGSAAEACAWIEGETGQRLTTMGYDVGAPRDRAA